MVESVTKAFEDLQKCNCEEEYTLEKGPIGHTLFFARCEHKAGFPIMSMVDCKRPDILKSIPDCLNKKNNKG
jgi:hypothetical protein